MAAHKGQPKVGGRKKGTPNKVTLSVRERIAELGGDPVLYLVKTMNNDIPCVTCRGTGRTEFQPGTAADGEDPSDRRCQSCWGRKKERIAPAASQSAAEKLMGYIAPTLKAIEHTGLDGAAMPIWQVVIKTTEEK